MIRSAPAASTHTAGQQVRAQRRRLLLVRHASANCNEVLSEFVLSGDRLTEYGREEDSAATALQQTGKSNAMSVINRSQPEQQQRVVP